MDRVTLGRELWRRHEMRRADRAPYETKWAEIAPMIRPIRDEFRDVVRDEGQYRGIRNYDSAAPVAADEAGNAIYSMMTSTDNVWAPVEFEDERLKQDRAAAQWIEHANKVLFSTLDPAVSSFYTDAPETILDCLCFGNGAFYSARPPGATFFVDQALPLSECYVEHDAFGQLSHFDRVYELTRWAILDQFGKDAVPEGFVQKAENAPGERLKVLHATFRQDPNDAEKRVGRKRFASVYVLAEQMHVLETGNGYDEMPYFFAHWIKARGERYGRGRGEFALPDAEILSEMGRTGLIQDQRLAEPPLAAHNDVGDIVSLEPNEVNRGAIDDAGRMLIQPITLGGNVPTRLEAQEQRRQQIREIFFQSLLTLVGSPTPSVVEILKRDERREQNMGPNLARIMQSFLAPFIMRRFNMLARAQQFDPPPPAAQGQKLRARFVSPLAKMHRSQKARSVLETAGAVAQVAAIDPRARFKFNGVKAVDHIVDGLAAPADILRSDDEVAALIAQEQEAQAIAFATQNAEIGARAVESAARAEAAGMRR